MTDATDDTNGPAHDDNTIGKTTHDIAEAGSSGAEANDDDKAQEDLDAEDLKGFVKDPLEQ